ncbi:unnamed protein product [Caenorhabditis angaria]|uniref:Uncharacterized protein n=1 Tax=Caenorhabditis angaria TaxID=860376 RepID=A0A9P1IX33_9PELO|nr:unnamed protein product [Caenorhabditis angaria]
MIRMIRFKYYTNSHYFAFFIKFFLIFLLIFVCFIWKIYPINYDVLQHPHLVYLKKLQENTKPSECLIPKLDPWDKSILKYYDKSPPLICDAKQIQLVESFKNGIITFNSSLISNMKCSKTQIQHNEGVSDNDVLFGKLVELDFSSGLSFPIKDEFFEINCESTRFFGKNSYKKHFAQIVPKIEENLKMKKIELESEQYPSVIMIGMDSMSHSNFIRQMPLTMKLLEKWNFVDLKGHMKIHDNTYGNTIAILTGKRGTSVKEFKAELNEDWNIAFDDFPFIWNNFSENGYVTLFAEDRPDIATFNYKSKLNGFLNQPTDHYLRPFWQTCFWSLISRRSSPSCYDNQKQHMIQLNYLEDFIRKYEGKRKFGYFWTQDMSHGFINLIGRTDQDYRDFLERNEKYLRNSIVYLFSDHGHRSDKIRETIIGRIESRMPFHAIRIPEDIRKKYPKIVENLKHNSNGITTQFDVFEGLKKIANGNFLKELEQKTLQRGYSYFDKFPKRQTCYAAGIPSDYCPCLSEIEVPKSEMIEASNEFLKQLNVLLEEKTEQTEEYERDSEKLSDYMCSPIEMDSIQYAAVRLPVVNKAETDGFNLKAVSIQYHMVIKAKPPSRALLETTIEFDLTTNKWSTIAEIERNNKYGNTSFCVNDAVLKKVCHCVLRKSDSIAGLL